ncbi:MAG: hypothetical protein ACYSUQ_06630 [Planctomycetota bacterium]|jgi:hypothetical protein
MTSDGDILDTSNLTAEQIHKIGKAILKLGTGCSNMEVAADKIVRFLYDQSSAANGGPKACALVRFYKTHPFAQLPPDLQEFAEGLAGDYLPTPSMKCLTLLASAGDKPEWNDRASSQGHKAIPLPSPQAVEKIPMVAQLVKQFGLEISTILQPDANVLLDAEQKTLNVFHIPEAAGSPYIPAQTDFVQPLKIRSVVGFGSLLPSGDLFAVILFCRVNVSRDTADRLTTLALNVKETVLPFDGKTVFAP